MIIKQLSVFLENKTGIKNNGIEYEASRGMKNRKISQEYNKETACNSDIKISDEQIKLIEDVLREYLA